MLVGATVVVRLEGVIRKGLVGLALQEVDRYAGLWDGLWNVCF